MSAPAPRVLETRLILRDRLAGIAVRLNVGRSRRSVEPGLYAIGAPTPESPVLVTANYQPSVDAVRSSLSGIDAWLLVIDTRGINVWCAAGKDLFGTVELSRRVLEVGLATAVSHRILVLPQLAAPGVTAHDVRSFTGFRVVWGPVRAADIPDFLRNGMSATPEMRRVTFTLPERLAVTGVELSQGWRPRYLLILALLAVLGGLGVWGYSPAAFAARGAALVVAAYAGLLVGGLLVPLLLPALPFRSFSANGALAGAVVGAVLLALFAPVTGPIAAAAAALACVALSSAVAMNFTGATPITSPSGVLLEMRTALPWQIGAAALALTVWIATAFQSGVW